MKNNIYAILSISGILFITACGGGGGGDAPAAPAQPPVTPIDYPLRTAYTNYIVATGANSFTVTGSYVGGGGAQPITGSGSGTWGALTSSTFENIPAQKKAATVIGTGIVSGSPFSLNSTEYAYFDSNYNPLGGSGSEYYVVTSSTSIPITARVNDAGSWYVSNRYTTSAKTQLIGTSSVSYVIQEDTATTAYLSIIENRKDTVGKTTYTGSVKFRMTEAGTLTRINENGTLYSSSPSAVTTITINY